MLRPCKLVFLVSLYFLKYCASKSGKKPGFEVKLENVQDCEAPSPPYVKESTVITDYKIVVVNGTRYLTGNTTIIEPTPFQNLVTLSPGWDLTMGSWWNRGNSSNLLSTLIDFLVSLFHRNSWIPSWIARFGEGQRPELPKKFSARTYVVDRTGKRVVKTQISEVSCRNFLVKVIVMFANITFSPKKCLINQGFTRYEYVDLNRVMHAIPTWHAPGDVFHELQLVVNGATEFCTEIKVKIIKV